MQGDLSTPEVCLQSMSLHIGVQPYQAHSTVVLKCIYIPEHICIMSADNITNSPFSFDQYHVELLSYNSVTLSRKAETKLQDKQCLDLDQTYADVTTEASKEPR